MRSSSLSSILSSSARAKVTNTSPRPPFPIQRFSPLSSQDPSDCRTANERIAEASEPASGSVSAKPASRRPAARSGSSRAFCSSEPKSTMPFMPIDWWTPRATVSDPSTWPKASKTRA
jgi:hypothetical protein